MRVDSSSFVTASLYARTSRRAAALEQFTVLCVSTKEASTGVVLGTTLGIAVMLIATNAIQERAELS